MSDFELTSTTTVQPIALIPSSSVQDTITYTIFDDSGAAVATGSRTTIWGTYDNIGDFSRIEQVFRPDVTLPPGCYRIEVSDPAFEPAVRVVDLESGITSQLGHSIHSGPILHKDGANTLRTYVETGGRKSVIYDGSTVYDNFQSQFVQLEDRYHNTLTILPLQNGGYFSTRSSHALPAYNGQYSASLSMPGIGSAIGAVSDRHTYSELVERNPYEVFIHSRRGNSQGGIVYQLVDVTQTWTTSGTNNVNDFLHDEARHYPRGIFVSQGGVIAPYEIRTGNSWEQFGVAYFDSSVGTRGQWFNSAGVAVGASSTGTSFANSRWTNEATDLVSAGGNIQRELQAGEAQVYATGRPAVRRNATGLEGVWVYSTHNASATTYGTSEFNLLAFNGAATVDLIDAFSLGPKEEYRGPSDVWYVGDDVYGVIAVRTRGNVGKALYYDFGGDELMTFKITEPHLATSAADLKSRISILKQYRPVELGFDLAGNVLAIVVVRRVEGTDFEFGAQCGVNQHGENEAQHVYHLGTVN